MRIYKPIFFLILAVWLNNLACQTRTDSQTTLALPLKEKSANTININTATFNQLEKLEGIGEKLAKRIIEHREKYGNFRKTEYLILVKGMSEKRFKKIESFVSVE